MVFKKTSFNLFRMTFCLAFLIVLSVNTIPQSQIEVIAKGSFPFSNSFTTNELHNYALKDAYFKAIEEGVGIFVKKTTSVKNYKDVVSISMTKSDGYIKDFDIIDEGIEDDGKDYFVRIRAEVIEGSFLNDPDKQAYLIFNQIILNNPRIIYYINKSDKVKIELTSISSLLLEPFKTNGYTLLNENDHKFLYSIDSSLKSGITPTDYILSTNNNAEMLLLFRIDSDEGNQISSAYDTNLLSSRVSITYYLLSLENGELLYTNSVQIPGLGVSLEQSEYIALKKFQSQFVNEIVDVIPKLLSESPIQIDLTIENVDVSTITSIDDVMTNIPSAISIQLQNYNKIDRKMRYKISMEPMSGGSNAVWRYCYGFLPIKSELIQLNKYQVLINITN